MYKTDIDHIIDGLQTRYPDLFPGNYTSIAGIGFGFIHKDDYDIGLIVSFTNKQEQQNFEKQLEQKEIESYKGYPIRTRVVNPAKSR